MLLRIFVPGQDAPRCVWPRSHLGDGMAGTAPAVPFSTRVQCGLAQTCTECCRARVRERWMAAHAGGRLRSADTQRTHFAPVLLCCCCCYVFFFIIFFYV